jgi:hypothetical protein
VIKWIAVHEYCNVDLHLYNLIFVLVAYEAVSHRFYTTEKGGGGGVEKLEQVGFMELLVFLKLSALEND